MRLAKLVFLLSTAFLILVALLPGPTSALSKKEPSASPVPTLIVRGRVLEYRLAASGYAVQVEEVYRKDGTYSVPLESAMIVLAPDKRLEIGAEYVLHLNPVMFGNELVAELIATDVPTTFNAEEVSRVEKAEQVRILRERLRAADLVVIGQVKDVQAGPEKRRAGGESEHDPQFLIANLDVERALKGKAPTKAITFLFASSDDVQWYRAPKFKAGVQGVFLLKRAGQAYSVFGVQADRYTLLHPLDVQPVTDLQSIEQLLK